MRQADGLGRLMSRSNINLPDGNGISPLLMTISNNQIPVAAFLLSRVADPNAAA